VHHDITTAIMVVAHADLDITTRADGRTPVAG